MLIFYGAIGEVVNTPDCGSGMHRFDSDMTPHIEIYTHSRVIYNKSTEKLIFLYCNRYIKMLLILKHNKIMLIK